MKSNGPDPHDAIVMRDEFDNVEAIVFICPLGDATFPHRDGDEMRPVLTADGWVHRDCLHGWMSISLDGGLRRSSFDA